MQLSLLVQEFLRTPGVDPSIETAFRHFLAERAARSHPGLENALDWVLALYKFAFPFLIISLLAKLSSGAGGGGDTAPPRAIPLHRPPPQLLGGSGKTGGNSPGSGFVDKVRAKSMSTAGYESARSGSERSASQGELIAAAVARRRPV